MRSHLVVVALSGSLIGYVAFVLSVGVVTLIMYGADQLVDRFLSAALYVYPIISFSWLYGSFVVVSLFIRVPFVNEADG